MPHNDITDVPGVAVGHCTVIAGEGPHQRGVGPVRTGVTIVLPRADQVWQSTVFAGYHRLNGNGDLSGLQWIAESGQLGGPIALTNTYSLGTVRDALIGIALTEVTESMGPWSLPVVGETWDGVLNDIEGQHVGPQHVREAIDNATSGPIGQGCVGGGTGMTAFGFKAGIGSASEVAHINGQAFTVGALVQANFGDRDQLRIDGVPVGRLIDSSIVPTPTPATSGGSIIVILATDAPLLPHSCKRLAQRAALGIGAVGGTANNSSGDFALCFSTANRDVPAAFTGSGRAVRKAEFISDGDLTPLLKAAVSATAQAIYNSLRYATTVTGRDGVIAHALTDALLADARARWVNELSSDLT